jgi:deazaflavin-dependent oxidoreductase (nitroreductase family)
LAAAAGVVGFFFVVVPLFERFSSPRAVRRWQRLSAPFFRGGAGVVPGFGLIETTGRRSGLPRRTPVGGSIRGKDFWFVAGIGRRTNYVRNIEANPSVRVKALGRWHSGTAHLCPDDDARRRRFTVSPLNGVFLWVAGGDPLTVRIALDD